jgi:hypothetical protein
VGGGEEGFIIEKGKDKSIGPEFENYVNAEY